METRTIHRLHLTMKLQQRTHGIWDQHDLLSLGGCKRLRPLAPTPTHTTSKSKSNNDSDIHRGSGEGNDDNPTVHSTRLMVETHPGGTRWNPTQEQIGILEMLYGRGMRTPNAQQIEHIALQLREYGKIEGKNVFYWFQNHKARQRQKHKRSRLADIHFPTTLSREIPGAPCKRKSRSCGDEGKSNSWIREEDRPCGVLKTLDLFPLRPEAR